jgi:hypothetical protein
VRRVSAATGIIITIAGDGRLASAGDGGPAIHASLASPIGIAVGSARDRLVVYVTDLVDSKIRVIDADGGITTLDGTTRFVAPTRLAYHPAGWLYVKDASPDGVAAVATSRVLHASAEGPPAASAPEELRRAKKGGHYEGPADAGHYETPHPAVRKGT